MTIKTFTDLQGLKDTNVPELEQIGISSVSELKEALLDDMKVKEVIKSLSGVGPKTVENWKIALSTDAPVATEKAEYSDKPKSKADGDSTKEVKDKPKSKVEIVDDDSTEETSEVEIVEDSAYSVKMKPELTDEMTDLLAKRAIISGRRPAFKRQEWFRYSKLGEKWRRPKGIHSKMRRKIKRRTPMVDIGFRGPIGSRGLHPSGFEEVLVHNVDGLENINPKVQAVRIGRTVGTKKRIAIEDRATELGIRVFNRMV